MSPHDRPLREPADIPAELAQARRTIDNIDAALVHLLAERFACTKRVGVLKAEKNLPPADPEREARQITRLRGLADDSGLDPVFAEKFLRFIVDEVIRHHEAIAVEVRGDEANSGETK
ncbi:chorismate mutase [Nanchangia anserum]|uniref:Chorismate mutase n=1 Tax=Nanchangia anserum TaxID=2692125 RepID=A0A8I0GAU5_9ACTO|nr:chorismate mutase [Nanchangia anserum]MBD3688861.1 chorismate mutase [Nanchangia anserum]QOX81133.1 chorismate mutase [Nanchangia anserum]